MIRKYSILWGIIGSLLLLLVATLYYPGGSQYDQNAPGFDWQHNYLSNLFDTKAMNGSDNASRPWAVGGMLLLCASLTLFFVEFSKKITVKSAANIIQYFGVGAMLCGFLTVTPYHDIMVTIATTLGLVSLFYIAVFVFKSKLLFFKIFGVVCLLVSYVCNYMYYTSSYLKFLPIVQKVTIFMVIAWILGLAYFTTKEDFPRGQVVKINTDGATKNR